MEKLNCIIVEDEPLAAEIIEDYVKQVPFLQLIAVCTDALYAMEVLQRERIDVMFLDIHLPKLKGLDFIRVLPAPPSVIITSAYREYALDGYELNVVDYLLKPVSFSRFIMAVNKLRIGKLTDATSIPAAPTAERPYLLVNVNKKKVRIYHDELLYIESKKEYINIVTTVGQFLTKMQITEAEELLGDAQFIRVHRSFIVARQRINAFTAAQLEVDTHSIPIGRSYKEQVLASLVKVSG